ncbi:DUF6894 family protein [Tianweitania sp.]|uniref:DUF6894 family protein n=1 Tax=Tianweitania sp. TaxID=2021634 RepID=UPI00289B0005|nr:hypothetical protein [Tianweitania sp.]
MERYWTEEPKSLPSATDDGGLTPYFFDFREGNSFVSDNEGVEFASLKLARMEAAQAITGYAKDVATEDGRLEIVIEVRTGRGWQVTSRIVLETTG